MQDKEEREKRKEKIGKKKDKGTRKEGVKGREW